MHVITAVFTQGRFGNGRGAEFIEAYTLYYWRPGMTDFFLYRDSLGRTVLPANDNTYTIANNTLEPPIFAQKIRLFPFSEQPRTPCVRLEYVGCIFKEGVVSYAIPQGMLRGSTLELMDHTYDGKEDPRTGELRGGLGQLVDGHFGYGNFKTGGQGLKGYEWLGWKRKSNQDSVNLVFAFDQVRSFQRVDIHTNNHFTKDIQVFRQARVYFSNEEDKFGDDRVVDFKYMPDLALENARNVSINLKNSHGQYCMLQLFFNAKWILISEITFYSTPKVENLFVVPKLQSESDLTSDSPIASDQVEVAPIDRLHPVDSSGHSTGDEVESSSQIGIIIGVLITVIFLLVMGITFVLHQARVSKEKRSTPTHLVSAKPEHVEYLTMASAVAVEKPTGISYEETIYEEPLNCLPSTRSYLSTEDLTDEYAEPGAISLSYSLSENIYAQANRLPPLPISHYARPCTPETARRPSNSSSATSPQLPEAAEAMARLNARLNQTSSNAGSLTGFKRSASIDTVNVELNEIDPKLLTLKEKLGNGQFGEIHLCQMKDDLVAVKFLQADCDPVTRSDFENEARILSSLRDPNLVRVLGVCYEDAVCMVCEYSIYGDLCQYLLDHVAETTLSKSPNVPTLSYGCLIYVASQIASGMKYLESLNFVHRDLAARNCLVGPRLQIKICDYGMSRSIYKGDYYRTESGCLLPIRWMSWESVLLVSSSNCAVELFCMNGLCRVSSRPKPMCGPLV